MHAFDLDGDVLELCANRNMSTAVRRLMQRHGEAVYRYCRRQLRNATLAEDVYQQIFIAAHRDLWRFEGRSTVRTWLFVIARHRVRNAARSRARQERRAVELAKIADVHEPRPLANESLDDRRLRHALEMCLAQLPESTQTAVLLRYQQGFTFEEMAEICGEKPGTLQARVARAMLRLRELMENMIGNGW